MLYLPSTKFHDSGESVVAPGAIITDEGAALVRAAGASSSGVTVSQGTSGEIFAGFSIAGVSAAPFAPADTSKSETFTVPSSGSIALAFTPISGQVFVFDNTTGAAVAITGGVTLTNNVIAGLTAGDSVSVTYRYTLTVTQLRALQGDVQPGGYAGAQVGQIGVGRRGTIFTDRFDASKNWTNPASINLAAGGILTVAGSGVALVGAYVVNVPSVNIPFLGIRFSAV